MLSRYRESYLRGISQPQEPTRLNRAGLSLIPAEVAKPEFDIAELQTGIIHLGSSVFHLAHQAIATQHAIIAEGRSGLRWGIASSAMSRRTVPDALRPQDNLYTVLTQHREQIGAEICGAIREVVHAASDLRGLPARIADPNIRIITMTVTTNGYHIESASGLLSMSDPQIIADLTTGARPVSPVGILVRGLELIRAHGTTPPVILSCDNIPANGRTLHRALIDFASLVDSKLSAWIAANVQCPNTVSDRIVQSTTFDTVELAQSIIGVHDAHPVLAETYFNWTIEDFEGDRPLWESAGARFVTDIDGFELAKLRLLNGSHMFVAYLGLLAGYSTIADAMGDPLVEQATRQYMAEQGATLSLSSDEIATYSAALIERFRNPSIRQEMRRIGRNGSEKMFPRVVSAMVENMKSGRPTQLAMLLVASWIMLFDTATDKDADRIDATDIIDPLAHDLIDLAKVSEHDPHALATNFLARADIFGAIPDRIAFTETLAQTIADLQNIPIRQVIFDRILSACRTDLQ